MRARSRSKAPHTISLTGITQSKNKIVTWILEMDVAVFAWLTEIAENILTSDK